MQRYGEILPKTRKRTDSFITCMDKRYLTGQIGQIISKPVQIRRFRWKMVIE